MCLKSPGVPEGHKGLKVRGSTPGAGRRPPQEAPASYHLQYRLLQGAISLRPHHRLHHPSLHPSTPPSANIGPIYLPCQWLDGGVT